MAKHNLDNMSSVLKMLFVLTIQLCTCHDLICHKGEKSVNKLLFPICDLCEDGRFMPEANHTHTECYLCSQVRDANTEILIRDCSREQDTLILCRAGLFRDGKMCKNCTVCEPGCEILTCYGNTDAVCCPSDSYVKDDGVSRVCKVRTLPCRQGQFFTSEHKCAPCLPGTYMVDNHHNYTACNSCQQLLDNREIDDYVAVVCNINCSHLPDVYKKCLGEEINIPDQNKTGNVTDQMSATSSVRIVAEVFYILQICVYTFGFIVFIPGFVLYKCATEKFKWVLSLKKYLAYKTGALKMYVFVVIFLLVVSCLVSSISLHTEISDTHISIHFVRLFQALCVCALIVLLLPFVLLKHLPEKLNCDDNVD